ncbi:MAG: c-type cytochrome [Planctomycetes bacterium]|nr:c-type cytochrome [Planctomycetota bacterium]
MPSSISYAHAVLGGLPSLLLVACSRDVAPAGSRSGPAQPQPRWTSAPASEPLQVPSGLVLAADLVARPFAAEPLLKNPVAFDVDDRGRVWVAETHRYLRSVFDITQQPAWLADDLSFRTVAERRAFLLRAFEDFPVVLLADSELVRLVVDDDHDGVADRSTVFAEEFRDPAAGTAAGVLAFGEDLWFACIPDLWRFPGGLARDVATERESLADGFGVHIGVSGHDLHGLTMGPDGRLWFSIGDRGVHLVTREGVGIELPDTGLVLRCEPDGSALEVFAHGLRNPQELAFDELGNLFTVDNDTAGDDPTRVLYVVDGGDYGWRFGYQHAEGFGPWVKDALWRGGQDGVLPSSGFAAQGPAGLAFHPGVGFSPSAKGRFFVCDFPGGVVSFGLEPRGAGFGVTDTRRVAWGLWPTDLAFGPDGALWILDWVSGWGPPDRGRIHRVYEPETIATAEVAELGRLLREGLAGRPLDELAELLAHADSRIRLRAHLQLAARGPEGAKALARVLASTAPRLPRLHALFGLGVAARRARAETSPIVAALDDPDTELRVLAARLCGELGIARAEERLGVMCTEGYPREAFAAAIALGRLRAVRQSSRVLAMLGRNRDADAFLTHAGVEAMRQSMTAPDLAALALDEDVAVRRAAVLALRRRGDAAITAFLDDAAKPVRIEAARAIHDASIAGAAPALASRVTSTSLDDECRTRAIATALHLGRNGDAEALAELAGDPRFAVDDRVRALAALAQWADPDAVDAVTGAWRVVVPRDAEPARVALRPALAALAADGVEAVVAALVSAIVRLELREAVPALTALAGDGSRGAQVRAAALHALARFEPTALSALLESALQSSDEPLRLAALEVLPLAAHEPSAARLQAMVFADSESIAVRQAAIAAAARLPGVGGAELLARCFDGLERLPAELHLDVLDAAASCADRALADRARARFAPRDDDPLAPWRTTLVGGDVARGRRLFETRADVSCLRCHAIKGVGGTVGPKLDGLATRADPAQILESVVRPAATITPGYPPAMPDLASHVLSRAELRDLLAYLRSLR